MYVYTVTYIKHTYTHTNNEHRTKLFAFASYIVSKYILGKYIYERIQAQRRRDDDVMLPGM